MPSYESISPKDDDLLPGLRLLALVVVCALLTWVGILCYLIFNFIWI